MAIDHLRRVPMILSLVLGLAVGAQAAPAQKAAQPTTPPAASTAQTADACDCEVQRPETLAVVNGVKISAADVDAAAAEDLAQVRSQADDARGKTLQNLIDIKLLDQEAKRRGISRVKLVQSEVYEKVPDPTDDEVRAFYDRNRASIQGEYDSVKAKLLE